MLLVGNQKGYVLIPLIHTCFLYNKKHFGYIGI